MLKMTVTGMTCSHCVSAVRRAVATVPGATDVTVDLATGRVTIDGTPDPAVVQAAIEDEGYHVQSP